MRLVTLGAAYSRALLMACCEQRRKRYPSLLTAVTDRAPGGRGASTPARPHLPIEHRVVPAGPSIIDTIANAAPFFQLVTTLITQARAPEAQLPFEYARTDAGWSRACVEEYGRALIAAHRAVARQVQE